MKLNTFIRIIIALFIILLSNNLFAISENTLRILKKPQGIKVVDTKGNIHIVTMETEKYYGKKIVGIDEEKDGWDQYIIKVAHIPEKDKEFYTYELIDSIGNVLVPKRRLCKAKQGGHFLRGEWGKGLFPELKPSGPIIVGGSESGFDSRGMLRIIELDKMGNVKKMHRPNTDCPSFNLLWNGKELFYLNSNGEMFMIYKQVGNDFEWLKIELEDLGIKKRGRYNYRISKDFGSFLTEDGNIVVLIRSTDPDDFDKEVHEKYAVSGYDIIGVFIISQDGEIVSPMKKYNMKEIAFKKFTSGEEKGLNFSDWHEQGLRGIGTRIAQKDTIVYAYFRGYAPETKKLEIYQLRLTPEGEVIKSKSLETEKIKPLEELPSGFPIYHSHFAHYAYDSNGDMYLLIQ